MNYRILVPLECTEVDDEVIPFVRKMVVWPGARLTLLHVLPDLLPYVREYIDAECDRARRQLCEFRDRIGGDLHELGCELRMGDPAREILRFAALQSVDLIIMPAHGRSGLDRLIHGSVTEQVLRTARCPLLLPHAGAARSPERGIEHLFDRILVPVDGSGRSFSIIPLVVEFARNYGSEVILFHDYEDAADDGEYLTASDIDKRIQDYRALLGYAGISASTAAAAAGRPTGDILEAIADTDADLVAMATHGRSGLGLLSTGSVVARVLRHGSRPLLACNVNPGQEPEGMAVQPE